MLIAAMSVLLSIAAGAAVLSPGLDVIANEYDEIAPQLRKIIENPEMIKDYSRKAFDCGKKNHNENDIKKIFVETFVNAAKKGK